MNGVAHTPTGISYVHTHTYIHINEISVEELVEGFSLCVSSMSLSSVFLSKKALFS